MTQTALSEQMAKLNPQGGGVQLLARVQNERAQARQAAAMGVSGGYVAPTLEQIDAGLAVKDEAQRRLEEEHSQLATVATQAGRGALDVLLGSGALAGLFAEGAGEIVGSEGLAKFGRDLGEASSGRSALQALAFGAAAPVEGKQSALDVADRARRDIDDQQKAWPMLAAVSHAGGQVAAGVALGGLAAAGAKAPALIAAGAYEGAAGGAQIAYENNASLRDVLSSTMLGGLLGAGTAGGAVGLTKLVQSRGLKQAMRELASESAVKATGARGSDMRALVGRRMGEAADQRIDEIGQELLTYEMSDGSKLLRFGDKPEDLVRRVAEAKGTVGQRLGAIKDEIDEALVARPEVQPDIRGYLQKVDSEVLKPLRASNVPAVQARAQRVEEQLGALRERVAIQDAAEAAEPMRVRLPDGSVELRPRVAPEPISFKELDQFRRDLRSVFQPPKPKGGGLPAPPPEHAEALERAERLMADHLNESAESALGALGRDSTEFAKLRKQFSNFSDIEALVNKAAKQDLGNRSLSLTDTIAGGTAAAGTLASGAGGLATLATSALSSLAHKVVRERGRAALAVIANGLVMDTIRPAMERLLPALELGATSALARSSRAAETAGVGRLPELILTREEKQERYQGQLATISKAVTSPDPQHVMRTMDGFKDLPPTLVAAAGSDAAARMQQLAADIPKPEPNVRGKAYETLSSDQVRRANAMFEATTDPMSLFDDFAAGDIDYDKVQYTWKQYPGLKVAAQAGLMDALTMHLDDDERGAVPDSLLSQLDYLFGFDGELQPTVSSAFAARMTAAAEQEAQQTPKPDETGPLNLPAAQPTMTQRIAGV